MLLSSLIVRLTTIGVLVSNLSTTMISLPVSWRSGQRPVASLANSGATVMRNYLAATFAPSYTSSGRPLWPVPLDVNLQMVSLSHTGKYGAYDPRLSDGDRNALLLLVLCSKTFRLDDEYDSWLIQEQACLSIYACPWCAPGSKNLDSYILVVVLSPQERQQCPAFQDPSPHNGWNYHWVLTHLKCYSGLQPLKSTLLQTGQL